MSTSDLPKSYCGYCGVYLDQATPSEEGDYKPEEGSISLCFKCGGVHTFQKDLTLRKTEPEEFLALHEETRSEVIKIQRAIRARHR